MSRKGQSSLILIGLLPRLGRSNRGSPKVSLSLFGCLVTFQQAMDPVGSGALLPDVGDCGAAKRKVPVGACPKRRFSNFQICYNNVRVVDCRRRDSTTVEADAVGRETVDAV